MKEVKAIVRAEPFLFKIGSSWCNILLSKSFQFYHDCGKVIFRNRVELVGRSFLNFHNRAESWSLLANSQVWNKELARKNLENMVDRATLYIRDRRSNRSPWIQNQRANGNSKNLQGDKKHWKPFKRFLALKQNKERNTWGHCTEELK